MKYRYGQGFVAGIIDDMDATYEYELNKNKNLTPKEFFNWYIDNEIDVQNIQEIIDDPYTPSKVKLDYQILLKRLKK